MMKKSIAPLVAIAAMVGGSAAAAPLDPDAIEAATYEGGPLPDDQNPIIVKLQVLLDRAGISPGVVDGQWGENVKTALMAYEEREGLEVDGELDRQAWESLSGPDTTDIMAEYTVTQQDVDGPFVDEVPDDWRELAEMDRVAYTSVGEMLAERFHMDIEFFASLNGGLEPAVGDTVTVAQPGQPDTSSVARVEVSRSGENVKGFDEQGNLIAHYPATVGSDELPSPSGSLEVKAIAPDPNYTFQPENIPEADIDETLIIPPGPNNPVGAMWIDLTKPTYGLHGTPDPASIGKVASHGCVRMTNWDAEELANRIEQGTPVVFVD